MLKDIIYTDDLCYASDRKHKPIEFYLNCLQNSTKFDLRLGYFSSNAIRVLSLGFAQFIYNGGEMRIITNHYLSDKDLELLNQNLEVDDIEVRYLESVINTDVEELRKILAKGQDHFFNCLRYLLNKKRLTIQPVKRKPNKLSHYKEGIFYDGSEKVFFNGSCNFTYSGLIENGESLEVRRSWGSDIEQLRISNGQIEFEAIFNKVDSNYDYLDTSQIEKVIYKKGLEKDLEELVQDEFQLHKKIEESNIELSKLFKLKTESFKNWVKDDLKLPTFPFNTPYEYQSEAYLKWCENNSTGIFAMATGTGKTLTSLNCVLEDYRKNPDKNYRVFILVPTITLVEQWENEARKFNFKNIIKISSKSNWKSKLAGKLNSVNHIKSSFIIISTYATFSKERFQKYVKKLPADTILIADEAHNLGSKSVVEKLSNVKIQKRIALSATPERIYDTEGTEIINKFFNDSPPYIVSYSMEKAINGKNPVLTKYDYYPHIVDLTSNELEAYHYLTKKIAKQFFIEPDISKNNHLERLLLKRKRIIHKASNKLPEVINILKSRFNKEGHLKYTFLYVPEGIDPEISEIDIENEDESRIINQYINEIANIDRNLMINKIVGGMKNRLQILEQFSRGDIHVLASMKCLDEGVDIPRAQHAIFCSSTGNPRQFIQRRGRVLRKHPDKTFATIHDLVVVPDIYSIDDLTFEVEKNLFIGELKRVIHFASIAKNPDFSFNLFDNICKIFDIDINLIFNELIHE